MPKRNPFKYFHSSPEIIRLAVVRYVRFPLSLRNVEDLLHVRGLDVSHESRPRRGGRYRSSGEAHLTKQCLLGSSVTLKVLATLRTVVIFAFLPLSDMALAQGTTYADRPPLVDRLRDQVRTGTSSLAENLDEFLSDTEYEREQNQTRLGLQFFLDQSSDRGTEFHVEPTLRLRLPHLQNIVFLDIFGSRGSGDNSRLDLGGEALDEFLNRDNERAIQLRAVVESQGIRYSPVLGLDFENDELKIYVGGRASASKELSESIAVFGSQRLLYHSNRGFEANTLAKVDWQISDSDLIRGQFQLDWRENESGISYQTALIYRRLISEKSVISFENYIQSATRPNHEIESFLTGLRYRRIIYKNWIFGEISPWLLWEKSKSQDVISGIQFMMEVKF